ncbi:ATP-dependent DNA ligase [soil metagenome]
MAAYFREARPADAAWAVYFLSGSRPKRLIPARRLATWAMEISSTPEWLFEESYHAVGDLAETISLLLGAPESAPDLPLHQWVERLLDLSGRTEAEQRKQITSAWAELAGVERFVWNKLITGGFRVGVARTLVVRALAQTADLDPAVVAHRLMGAWEPTAESYQRLLSPETGDTQISQPYPFFLAYALESEPEDLGDAADWRAEWKWDGIRAQLIRRAGQLFIWSRGEELITERFPELQVAATNLPDGVVLDGEILPWKEGGPLPFAQLQRRIGRKKVSARMLSEVPAVLIAYDLLELGGVDVREQPLHWRRAELEAVLQSGRLHPSLMLAGELARGSWAEARAARDAAREEGAEGLMLKRSDAPYGVGRRKGPWWKWKFEPFTVDAVMIYAQAGHGRRASLHTDYTFGVWDGDELVPFAKAYTGLSDVEIRKLDRWIRQNTLEKFGPVRAVRQEQVFELAFEGIQISPRHRSGLAVRFPRVLRWRTDKRPEDADSLDTLRSLMEST